MTCSQSKERKRDSLHVIVPESDKQTGLTTSPRKARMGAFGRSFSQAPDLRSASQLARCRKGARSFWWRSSTRNWLQYLGRLHGIRCLCRISRATKHQHDFIHDFFSKVQLCFGHGLSSQNTSPAPRFMNPVHLYLQVCQGARCLCPLLERMRATCICRRRQAPSHHFQPIRST